MNGKVRHIFFLFFVAFLLRLISLDQSVWLDEATTANVISRFSYLKIITQFSVNDFHPPLYYLFMKLWTSYFGISEIALRMPSVIFSLVTGVMIYYIGRILEKDSGEAKMTNLGYWSAAFFLFNPLIMYYSQEARMYMMATFFISANFYLYLKLKENITAVSVILFVLTILLSMSTFYGSIFYVGSLIIYSFIKKEFKIFCLSVFSLGGALVLLYPLLSIQMKHSEVVLQEVKNWKATLGTVTLKQLVLFPLKFATGRISFEPKLYYFFSAALWSAFLVLVGLNGISKRDHNKKQLSIFFFIATPIILGIIFSLHTPLLQYFRFQFVIIFISILLAASSFSFPRVRSIVFLGLLLWSLTYLTMPSFHREDWKSLAKNLLIESKPVYIISTSTDPLQYYTPFLSTRALQNVHIEQPTEKEIIVVPYTADIHGFAYRELLTEYKYELAESKHVRGIQYEVWKRISNFYAGSF